MAKRQGGVRSLRVRNVGTSGARPFSSFAQIRSIAWVHMSIQVLEIAGVIKLFPRHDDHVEARGGCERTSKAVNNVIAVLRAVI